MEKILFTQPIIESGKLYETGVQSIQPRIPSYWCKKIMIIAIKQKSKLLSNNLLEATKT